MSSGYLGLIAVSMTLVAGTPPASAAAYITASGMINLNGDFSPESSRLETEPAVTGDAFTRSIVSISDSGISDAGVDYYRYIASADIGHGELRVYGMLNNSDGSMLANFEFPMLNASARLNDVISLESTLPGSYDVTFELAVNGSLDIVGGNAVATAALSFGPEPGLDTRDSASWRSSGDVNEILSVTRTFSGDVDASIDAHLFFSIFTIDAGATMTGDFNHTAILTMILPEGVSVVGSESETFLTPIVVAPPVPLPAALPLLATGLTGLWLGLRAPRRGQQKAG